MMNKTNLIKNLNSSTFSAEDGFTGAARVQCVLFLHDSFSVCDFRECQMSCFHDKLWVFTRWLWSADLLLRDEIISPSIH